MRIFYYFGTNRKLKSGFSMKIWKVKLHDRTVQAQWGAAVLDKKKRRAVPIAKLRSKEWPHASKAKAKQDLENRIASKLMRGYSRSPRKRD